MENSEIYQNEIHPEVYIKNRRAIRKYRIGEALASVLMFAIGVSAFVLWLKAEGIW